MIRLTFELRGEHVELCDLLKLTGLADSGGRGKQMVAAGLVKVDGKAESRKTAKVRAGQIVACGDTEIEVQAQAPAQVQQGKEAAHGC